MSQLFMLDLFSGLGGASQSMRERGWRVVTVDNDPQFEPDLLLDIKELEWNGDIPDLIWASPPCTEFSKFAMPCYFDVKKLPKPNMSLIVSAKEIIEGINPRFWVIENVKGAVPFFEPLLGKPAFVASPYFLWGYFPPLGNVKRNTWGVKTKHLPSTAKAERAKIPESLSLAVALAIEGQPELI